MMRSEQLKVSDSYGDVASFITEETHRLATISINDYGFQLSARLAQTYLRRAVFILESKRTFDQVILREINALKSAAKVITFEYAQMEKFSADCDRFNQVVTKNVIEWGSKQVVRVISAGYLGTVGYHLAHKIRTFHSKVCSILMEE